MFSLILLDSAPNPKMIRRRVTPLLIP